MVEQAIENRRVGSSILSRATRINLKLARLKYMVSTKVLAVALFGFSVGCSVPATVDAPTPVPSQSQTAQAATAPAPCEDAGTPAPEACDESSIGTPAWLPEEHGYNARVVACTRKWVLGDIDKCHLAECVVSTPAKTCTVDEFYTCKQALDAATSLEALPSACAPCVTAW